MNTRGVLTIHSISQQNNWFLSMFGAVWIQNLFCIDACSHHHALNLNDWMLSCLLVCFCLCRPEQFRDTTAADGKTQEDSIPDDMLPPSDTESDTSDAGNVGLICNPNRQQQLCEADSIHDSDNSDDTDQQDWMHTPSRLVIRLKARLQPNIGFTLWRFWWCSAITPP